MADHSLCVHAHFSLLPRNTTLSGDQTDPMGDALKGLNEKLGATCYGPNAELKNFDRLSYDIGGALARWLEENTPETRNQIIAADLAYQKKWGIGNAIGQSLNHIVLPLASERDRHLQVRWGIMAFRYRFGRTPAGLWLPDMAVDGATLQSLYDQDIKFTILSQAQVQGATEGAGPYWLTLPSGDRMAVYVRDDWYSNQLAFSIQTLGGAGRWARSALAQLRREYGRLVLLALDGETFGYYYPGEEHFLHWLLFYEAEAVGYEVTSLTRDLRDHPPTQEIAYKPNTAWNCAHNLARWTTGCACTPGDSRWKAALRQAMDNLASNLKEIYLDYARELGIRDPWGLREEYFRVRLGELTDQEMMSQAGLAQDRQSAGLCRLLLANFYMQRCFTSHAFFYDDLDRLESYFAITNAARVTSLMWRATGHDLEPQLRRDLALAVSSKSGKSGAQMLDEVLEWAKKNRAA